MGFLTTKIIAVIAAILIAAVGTWGGLQYVKLQKAETEKVQAIADRDAIATERDEAIAANVASQVAIGLLQKEKADIQAALNALDADRKRNRALIANLSAAIKSQAADPANQVKLSPVLRTTIEAIQQQRAEREGEAK